MTRNDPPSRLGAVVAAKRKQLGLSQRQLAEKTGIKQTRLVMSADATLPLVYITDESKASPMTAPNFCMLLRKHLGGGKILSITQPGLERCIHLHIEHRNEMGDLCEKLLIAELMGKHSNIIFCDNSMRILDSIRTAVHSGIVTPVVNWPTDRVMVYSFSLIACFTRS